MTGRANALLAGVVLAGACACLAVADEPATVSGHVYAVSDGDTIWVGPDTHRVPVRLWGIVAPEFSRQCTGHHGNRYACGLTAAERLYSMIARDRLVTCDVRGRDQHERIVAECRNREGDLGGRLVALGWALDYPPYSRGYYRDREEAARSEKLGLHEGPNGAEVVLVPR